MHIHFFALTATGHASSDSEAAAWDMVTSLEVNSLPTTTSPSVSAAATSSGQPLEAPSLFHIQTRLADGRPSIIIDPGSVGNLCGDKWAREVAKTAGQDSSQATSNVAVPYASVV
jgi:hypothetical protein